MARSRRTVSILLLADDEGLGHVGDVVQVKPGYAHNFLFPAGRASRVTPDALQAVERAKERAVKMRVKRAAEMSAISETLKGMSLTLEERASEEGHLFGSVGAATIVEALAAHGVTIDEKQVLLDHPIKELGIFNVPIHVDAENTAEVRVWVVETGS